MINKFINYIKFRIELFKYKKKLLPLSWLKDDSIDLDIWSNALVCDFNWR